MSNESITVGLARDLGLSEEATTKAMDLLRETEALCPGDEAAQERAFSKAVGKAWVQGEPWATEWVQKATQGSAQAG